ncbi:MAG: hypothetical protein AB7V16_07165 [Vulcanibacillus sp.]
MFKLRYIKYFNNFIDWLYFGKVTSKVKSWDGGCESEIEYRGRNNKIIGYWAYGFYDPFLPYPIKKKKSL